MNFSGNKILVVFFSHTGQNYSNGGIIDLKKGNTAVAAEMLVKLTDADIFEIQSTEGYPYEYKACVARAEDELRANSRPILSNDRKISGYDVIILGFPNWCGTMPMPVWTFLENHDFTGKIILPFCTNEGSGMGNSERDLRRLCPTAIIKRGLPIHGSNVLDAFDRIESWLEDNKITRQGG